MKKLPAEVSLLTNLRVLKIEDNLLPEIPPLEALTELNEVSFATNQLKVFPVSQRNIFYIIYFTYNFLFLYFLFNFMFYFLGFSNYRICE